MDTHRTGPLPDVLARLADSVDPPIAKRSPTTAARFFGLVLCVATSAVVLVAVFGVGYP